jgi:hypothetical protein
MRVSSARRSRAGGRFRQVGLVEDQQAGDALVFGGEDAALHQFHRKTRPRRHHHGKLGDVGGDRLGLEGVGAVKQAGARQHRLDHPGIAVAPDLDLVAAHHAQVAALDLARQAAFGGRDDEAAAEGATT